MEKNQGNVQPVPLHDMRDMQREIELIQQENKILKQENEWLKRLVEINAKKVEEV